MRIALALVLVLAACESSPTESARSFRIVQGDLTLTSLGETVTLRAEATRGGRPSPLEAPVTWHSSAPTVATVDSTGLLTSVGNGVASIAATSGGETARVTVTVGQVVTSVSFDALPATVRVGQFITPAVRATLRDARGSAYLGASATMTLSLSSHPAAGELAGTLTAQTVGGTARFDAWLDRPGVGVRLRVDGAGFTATSGPIEVVGTAAVGAGPLHGCAVETTGALHCWGTNLRGRLGIPGLTTSRQPAAVVTAERFASVSVGFDHSCAVTTDGEGYCWGANTDGMLGDGTTTDRDVPTRVAGDIVWRSIVAGADKTCGVSTSDLAYCWGNNTSGGLGILTVLTFVTTPYPVVGGLRFASVDTFGSHSCGITTDERAWCWGWNGVGQLGNGASASYTLNEPQPVAGDLRFAELGVSGAHSCGRSTAGTVYCWGSNQYQQLGDAGAPSSVVAPLEVPGLGATTALAVGSHHACAVRSAGAALCWGRNDDGQLGSGTSGGPTGPTLVVSSQSFASLAASFAQTCGISTTSVAWCWGRNDGNQLGDGTFTPRAAPSRVAWPSPPRARITALTMPNTALSLAGASVGFTLSFINETGATLTGLGVQMYLRQGAARPAVGGFTVNCGGAPGVLAAGATCVVVWSVGIGPGAAGLLAPGAASLEFELLPSGISELRTVAVTITP